MYLNYPNNPTGAVATPAFLRDLVRWAKEYDVAICYDNPYVEIVFGDEKPLSLLSVPGAKDVAVELNSLSKPFNMTGWRIGMAVGNADLIAAIAQVKENTDSGIFNAIQYAGITALRQCAPHIDTMREIYRRRQQLVVGTLESIGLSCPAPRGTFYLWVPTPDGMSSVEFATALFERCQVVVAAGAAYGQYGEGYVRFSLTVPDDRLAEAMARIRRAFGPGGKAAAP
jgi:LL-diaminopimelate aminotransferase